MVNESQSKLDTKQSPLGDPPKGWKKMSFIAIFLVLVLIGFLFFAFSNNGWKAGQLGYSEAAVTYTNRSFSIQITKPNDKFECEMGQPIECIVKVDVLDGKGPPPDGTMLALTFKKSEIIYSSAFMERIVEPTLDGSPYKYKASIELLPSVKPGSYNLECELYYTKVVLAATKTTPPKTETSRFSSPKITVVVSKKR